MKHSRHQLNIPTESVQNTENECSEEVTTEEDTSIFGPDVLFSSNNSNNIFSQDESEPTIESEEEMPCEIDSSSAKYNTSEQNIKRMNIFDNQE